MDSGTILIALQVAGSLAILTAFALAQLGRVKATDVSYLVINLVGAIALGVPAALTGQWGFVLLETAWLGISIVGLVRRPHTVENRPAAPTTSS